MLKGPIERHMWPIILQIVMARASSGEINTDFIRYYLLLCRTTSKIGLALTDLISNTQPLMLMKHLLIICFRRQSASNSSKINCNWLLTPLI